MSKISLNPSLNITLQFEMPYKYQISTKYHLWSFKVSNTLTGEKILQNFKPAKDIRNKKSAFKYLYKPRNCFVFGIISHTHIYT